MRYYRHRFLLSVLGLCLPLVLGLAVLQDSTVSRLLLNFTLKLVRFQTGVSLDVEDWSVRPFSFAIVFEGFSLPNEDFSVTAKELQFQFSPLYLAVGRIQLKNFETNGVQVISNRELFAGKSEQEETNVDLFAFPNMLSDELSKLHDALLEKNLGVEDLSFKDTFLSTGDLSLRIPDFYFQSLGRGQARVNLELRDVSAPGNLDSIDRFELSALLMRLDRDNHFLGLRKIELTLDEGDEPAISLNGRLPGDLRGEFNLDLFRLNEFIKESSVLSSIDPDAFMSGRLKAELGARMISKSEQSIESSVSMRDFKIDIFHPNDVDFQIRSDFDSVSIENIRLILPKTGWEKPGIKNRLKRADVKIEGGRISGTGVLEEASLCGILKASSVPECHVDLTTSGSFSLDGDLENFELFAFPELEISEARTYADPRTPTQEAASYVVTSKPARLSGRVRILAKYMDLENVLLSWSDKSVVGASGRIIYKPSVVDLKVRARQLNLEESIQDFIGVDLTGFANTDTRIFYKFANEPVDRTKVSSTVTITDTSILGQSLGQLKGNVEYLRRRLRIGPLSISQGGGTAHVLGNLYQKSGVGGWLDIDCVFDEYQWGFASLGESPVEGVWSGSAVLRGALEEGREDSFSGPLELTGKNVQSFGIPFESAYVKSKVGLVNLSVTDLVAQKGNAELKLTGFFSDENSRVEFSSSNVAIASLGFFPEVESIVNSGAFEAKGRWSSGGPWEVSADISNIGIGSLRFQGGNFKVGGQDSQLNAEINMGNDARVSFQLQEGDGFFRLNRASGVFSSSAAYIPLAYINGWTESQPVRSSGRLEFDWGLRDGFIATNDFRLFGPKGSDAVETLLLDARGSQRIEWSNGGNTSGRLDISGDEDFSIRGTSGQNFELGGRLSAALLDLFLPDLFHLWQGSFQITSGQMSVPPKLKNINFSGDMRNITLSLPVLGQPVTALKGRINMVSALLRIQQATGRLDTGSISLEGQYRTDFESEGILLRTSMDKARVVLLEEYPMTVDGSLILAGEERPYRLSGTVNILSGLYPSEFTGFTPGIVTGAEEHDIAFNIRANVDDGFAIKNSLISTNIDGTLFILGNNLDPRLQGVLSMEGGALYARDNTFEVGQGTLSFAAEDANIPRVSMQASTELRYNAENYTINLLASGKATDLKLDFSSEPALSTQDTISLLTFGFIRSDLESDAGAGEGTGLIQSAGVEAFHAIFGKKIGANINRRTGFNINLTTKVDAEDEGAITRVEVMRKLGDKTTATFGRSLNIDKPENNLQVDYELLKNVNLTGVWESPEPEEQSVGADIRFKFDLK